jgi:hypothetical protein
MVSAGLLVMILKAATSKLAFRREAWIVSSILSLQSDYGAADSSTG